MHKPISKFVCVNHTNTQILLIMFSEETLVPYSKPSFPSPGGHSSSGTASSKGSTGPKKVDVMKGGHQRNMSDLIDVGYIGLSSQGQFSDELCKIILQSSKQKCLKLG